MEENRKGLSQHLGKECNPSRGASNSVLGCREVREVKELMFMAVVCRHFWGRCAPGSVAVRQQWAEQQEVQNKGQDFGQVLREVGCCGRRRWK